MYVSILRTNVANKAGWRWKTLSDNLEVEPATRDGFLATNLGVSNDATMSVLNHWAGGNTSKPSTWSALLDAMSASDMTAEADELEKVLLEGGVCVCVCVCVSRCPVILLLTDYIQPYLIRLISTDFPHNLSVSIFLHIRPN